MAAPVRPGLRLNLKVSVDVDELSGEEEPMDVVEAEEETEEQRAAFGAVTVRRSYKDLLPVRSVCEGHTRSSGVQTRGSC